MNDSIYYKLMDAYWHQCGTHTELWLTYALFLKWEMLSNAFESV